MASRNSSGVDGIDGKGTLLYLICYKRVISRKQNSTGHMSTSSSYGVGNTPKQSPMQSETHDNEYNAHN